MRALMSVALPGEKAAMIRIGLSRGKFWAVAGLVHSASPNNAIAEVRMRMVLSPWRCDAFS